MNGWNDQIASSVAIVEGILLLIVLLVVIRLSSKIKKLTTAHQKLMGETGVSGLEDVLHTIHTQLSAVDTKLGEHQQVLGKHEGRLSALKGRVGVHRFNAFSDSGSDLSFSIALVNEAQDGVVITGIHGREQMFLYAKPIDKGQSAYMLTPEEKTAISQAMQKG